MYVLNTTELKTLAIVADPNTLDTACRTALEKLARLGLIRPEKTGLTVSQQGQEALRKAKK